MSQANVTMERLWQATHGGNSERVAQILKKNPDQVVFTVDEYGHLIELGMAKESLATLRILIDFYLGAQMPEEQKDTVEYIGARRKLEVMLETAYESSSNTSDELKEIMSKYTSEPEYSIVEILSESSNLSEEEKLDIVNDAKTPETMLTTNHNLVAWIQYLRAHQELSATVTHLTTWYQSVPDEYSISCPDKIAPSQIDTDVAGNVLE